MIKLAVRENKEENTYTLVDIQDAEDINNDGREFLTGDKDQLIILASYVNDAFEKQEEKYTRQLYEKDMIITAGNKMLDFFQEIITKTLQDKLSEIDTMYALKTMLKETVKSLEQIAGRVEQIRDQQHNEEGMKK